MGTSVVQCERCKKFYAEFFKSKRKMKFLARIHKNHDNQTTPVRSDTS